MAIQFHNPDTPGIFLYHGVSSTLPVGNSNMIIGDTWQYENIFYMWDGTSFQQFISIKVLTDYLLNYYTKEQIDQMISNSLSGYLTTAQINDIILQLMNSININGMSLSDGEREVVLEEITSKIEEKEFITLEEVTNIISEILNQQLTENEVEIIVNDSLLGIVSTIAQIQADIQQIKENLLTSDEVQEISNNSEKLVSTIEDLSTHKTTDRFRWQDVYNDQKNSIIFTASAKGLKLAEDSQLYDSNSFPIEGPLNLPGGALVGVQMKNNETDFSIITINSEVAYSSEGLTPNVSVTKYFYLNSGDIFSVDQAEAMEVTDFIDDPESSFKILEKRMAEAEAKNQSLTIQIQHILNGDVDSILDVNSTTNIEETAEDTGFIVTNPLGGQISATAGTYLLVGTGAVWIQFAGQPEPTLVFDNRGVAVGIGSKAYVQDVHQGDIITQSGLTSLTYTNYIAKQ